MVIIRDEKGHGYCSQVQMLYMFQSQILLRLLKLMLQEMVLIYLNLPNVVMETDSLVWRTRYDNRSCILPVLKEIQGKGMYFIFIYSMLRGKQANIAAHNLAKFASLHCTGWDVRGRTKSLIVFSLPLYSA